MADMCSDLDPRTEMVFFLPFSLPSTLPLSMWVSQLSNIIELNIKKSCVVDLEDTQSVSVVRGSYFLEEGDSLDS